MPKVARKPFGNEKLDRRRKLPDRPETEAMTKKQVQQIQQFAATLDSLNELVSHYKIDPASPDKWFSLCLKLAYDYVPAMQIARKSGTKKQWSPLDELALFAIVEYRKKQTGKPYSQIYKIAYKDAESTRLSKLVTKSTSCKTIENHFQSFKSQRARSSEGNAYTMFEKLIPNLKDKASSGVLFAQILFSQEYALGTE